MTHAYTLTLSCIDRPGIVASVSGLLYECGGNVLEAQQFHDPETEQFFMRVEFDAEDMAEGVENFAQRFQDIEKRFDMQSRLNDNDRAKKVLLLVSKFDHCLGDLLYRHRIGELNMDVVGVVSNHPEDVLRISALDGIPFHHCPITRDTKPQQEARIKEIIKGSGAELVVLARYMQILSDDFSRYLEGRCINIHHSFLPGFKGAKPYHQAYERGVKMIGATAHYVTADLDEGPIIVQDVEHITHNDTPDDLIRKGRDIERRVLARAVQHHLEDRVLLNGSKTVVFKD